MSIGQDSKKIRVGFFPPENKRWMGGVNYYKNLFYALKQVSENGIEIVIFLPTKNDDEVVKIYRKYSDELHILNALDKRKLDGFLSKIEYRIFGSNILLEKTLTQYHIDVVSHIGFGGLKKIKSIGWIPDFQHIHLPEMFSRQEINRRNKKFKRTIVDSNAVFLSSNDAIKDFKNFAPPHEAKARILPFVSQPENNFKKFNTTQKQSFLKRYDLPENFFYLPNQFWKHKNHMVAFEAIKNIRNSGKKVCLVCTGKLDDYRSTKHIRELKNFISTNKLEKNIRLLGLVPYEDVFSLIAISHAVLNPSLFEGWSSTVEECKTIGKQMILSNINVHKEQAPNAIFFDKSKANELTNILMNYSPNKLIEIEKDLAFRTNEYADKFIDTIKSIV
jgi:glycosyltransferase involved in cell wall biosynthesis